LAEREEERDFFDLPSYTFGSDIDDPDVREAFNAKYRSFRDDRSPADVLIRIARSNSWSRNDVNLLSKLSADNFYRIFKDQKGEDLSRIVRASLQFEVNEETKAISAKATEALVRIGKESPINLLRVKKYGVHPDG
jgi:hypothetical protein